MVLSTGTTPKIMWKIVPSLPAWKPLLLITWGQPIESLNGAQSRHNAYIAEKLTRITKGSSFATVPSRVDAIGGPA